MNGTPKPRKNPNPLNLIFTCKICDKNFSRSDCLRRHKLMFHEVIKPYSCEVCGKAFAREYILNTHKKNHVTQSQSHPCSMCGSSFKRKDSLTRHMKKMHKETVQVQVQVEPQKPQQPQPVQHQPQHQVVHHVMKQEVLQHHPVYTTIGGIHGVVGHPSGHPAWWRRNTWCCGTHLGASSLVNNKSGWVNAFPRKKNFSFKICQMFFNLLLFLLFYGFI